MNEWTYQMYVIDALRGVCNMLEDVEKTPAPVGEGMVQALDAYIVRLEAISQRWKDRLNPGQ